MHIYSSPQIPVTPGAADEVWCWPETRPAQSGDFAQDLGLFDKVQVWFVDCSYM